MRRLQENYVEKIYAGLLGKIIGIRHGSNIEGWSYERIEKVYGEITDYLFNFKNFAADDDSNGPLFFIRALEDYAYENELTPEHLGLTWLNYIPYEHGFFWWGGYGKSTEHTAYINLRNGIPAPRSGSIEQNGPTVAEQIGGQIFIDTWGLLVPDDYKLAAEYAKKAASVSHGGNGIYGGMFVAACISAAFSKKDIDEIIQCGLSVIPSDCEYAKMAHDIINCHNSHPDNWKECFKFIQDNYSYGHYPGNCHIIPNSAVIMLSLLYGNGDFSKSINICNMCGWDTDCNVANVGTIIGVKNGLEGIDYKWRKPINDLVICSSVIGSLNILDIPQCALYISKYGYKIANDLSYGKYVDALSGSGAKYNFNLPGSTHGFRIESDDSESMNLSLLHSDSVFHSGNGALKISGSTMAYGTEIKVFNKTYYRPDDFNDSRYDPAFSPTLYPGQTISGHIMLDKESETGAAACLYVKDGNSGKYYESCAIQLEPGTWQKLNYDIPRIDGACLEEMGFKIISKDGFRQTLIAYIDDVDFNGLADYSIDFGKEKIEFWNNLHQEVSQFTYLKGIWTLEDGELSGSCSDYGEAYTGGYDWEDYGFQATVIPKLGNHHNINFRVQGAMRSYALGLAENNKLLLYKNHNGYSELMQTVFEWSHNAAYTFCVNVCGNNIKVFYKDKLILEYTDSDKPFLKGQIGVSVKEGSHCHYKDFAIFPIHI
ncbi:ADP-ribosylglycohydrolase family protein [Clostridium oryzae]|uniref:ADP-ribosylglycohydrolase n=1 Tax=Clostridium oryzae TaxID=1450648 RepID=A0A1V4IL74_9CLOT|nr:ADP-ribosylglycohydrolase family protein [Clostridium oryzae]OPJ60217.1 ADP-ribosylglycohydrolase [Clostridium oryzae]